MIPRRLIRCVPAVVAPEHEAFWARWAALHPGWETVTYQDPLAAAAFPITGHLFERCVAGAQVAGLVRLEAVWRLGGVYVDADFEPLRPVDALLGLGCFIGTEDDAILTDAMFGAEPGHPAIGACLERVVTLDMMAGPLVTGPDNTTRVLSGRADVAVLARHLLYPYAWTEKARRAEDFRRTSPDSYAVHHWAGSWLAGWTDAWLPPRRDGR